MNESLFVSVIMPCRNEADHIEPALNSILQQKADTFRFEVIVADGMSDDGTTELLEKMATADPRIKVIPNPEKITPFALNHGIRAAGGEIIVRMDAHTKYADDYIEQCVQVLLKHNADCSGGAWRAAGENFLQKAIATAFQSPFSAGGAKSHRVDYEGPVDAVYLGCWRKETLESIGLFDEEFVRNQDDELSLRLSKAGKLLWQSPKIWSCYYPRSSVKGLFRQYHQYGYWKVRVIQKHKLPASIRHLVPALFTLALGVSALGAPWLPWSAWIFGGLAGSYLSVSLFASLLTAIKMKNLLCFPVFPVLFGAFHFGYGTGFLAGMLDFMILSRGGQERFTALTRNDHKK